MKLFEEPGPLSDGREDTLDATVDRVVFANEDSAFAVVRLRVEDRSEKVTAVGSLFGVQPGESLRLHGRWKSHRRFGEQFEVVSYTPILPETEEGIRRYLGSGIVQGIGPALAQRLVDRFGLRTLHILENDAERLREVQGIGAVRSARITAAWQKQRGVHEVMVFLQGHGLSAAFAARVWRRLGDRAVAAIRQNPYRLALEVPGIGFKKADALASSLGIASDAPERLAAGVLHVLAEATSRGHLFLPRGQLADEAARLLEVPPPRVESALEDLARRRETVEIDLPRGERGVYPHLLYEAETEIVARLASHLQQPPREPEEGVSAALKRFERRARLRLAPAQREAIRRALRSPITILTGGPGTGKTTLLRGLLHLELERNGDVLLAAPTGRAAKRLAEATGAEAKTVHRLLEIQPREGRFLRNAERPLEADLVVVDEASMLDVTLFRDLMAALPETARLLLVGDVDQLPSVGPGRILGDLIESRRVEVIRLTEIYRQASESAIVTNAHRIREGHLPRLDNEASSDFHFVDREDPEAALATLEELVTRRIPRHFGLDAVRDIQVLTPMRKGVLGTHLLNARLQETLNPEGPSLRRGRSILRVGDKVMQTRNNYQLDVFNGDIGRIAAIREEDLELEVEFDGRRVLYETDDLDDLLLAYACSVHKSQGSEYPAVVLLLHTQHWVMLQRNLLYTAVTRGRRLVIVVGNRRALAVAARSRGKEERHTLLARRLAEATA